MKARKWTAVGTKYNARSTMLPLKQSRKPPWIHRQRNFSRRQRCLKPLYQRVGDYFRIVRHSSTIDGKCEGSFQLPTTRLNGSDTERSSRDFRGQSRRDRCLHRRSRLPLLLRREPLPPIPERGLRILLRQYADGRTLGRTERIDIDLHKQTT